MTRFLKMTLPRIETRLSFQASNMETVIAARTKRLYQLHNLKNKQSMLLITINRYANENES